MRWHYLDLEEFFLLAEAITGVHADRLAASPYIRLRAQAALYAPRAEVDGRELYPTLGAKAGILAFRVLEERPLPNSIVRMAWICLDRFINDNGGGSVQPAANVIDQVFCKVMAGHLGERDFITWVCRKVVVGSSA